MTWVGTGVSYPFLSETALCESAQYSQEPREVNPNAQINRLNKCWGWHNRECWSERRAGQEQLPKPRPRSQTPGDDTEKVGVKASGESAVNSTCKLYSNPTVHVFHFPPDEQVHEHPHTNGSYVLLNEQYVQGSRIEIKIEVIRIIC